MSVYTDNTLLEEHQYDTHGNLLQITYYKNNGEKHTEVFSIGSLFNEE